MANENMKGKPKPKPVTATTINVVLSSPGPNKLHFDFGTLPAGEEIIWTFVEWGDVSTGTFQKIGSAPIYQAQWTPDITDWDNGNMEGYAYKVPAGTWAMRITGANGVVSNSLAWGIYVSNVVPDVVMS